MIDKICKNCEHYTGPREVKNGFLGVSVNAGYSDKAICTKTNHKATAGCSCNCGRFEVWGKLELELEKEQIKKDKAREEKENRRQAVILSQQTRQSHYEEQHNKSKPLSEAEFKLMEAQMKQTIHEGHVRDFENMKKLKAVPIIFSVLGVILLVLGIVFKVIGSKSAESITNPNSYYAKQNASNAETTSTIGIVFIIVSIFCIIVPWLIWFYKYSKVKKLAEEI